jgi:F420H(2)-dependent biliverdin reductase
MALDPAALPDSVLEFLRERHLATLTTVRRDGSPHVVAIGFAYDPAERLVRIITSAGTQKAVNAGRGARAVVAQVDGGRWLSLEGTVSVSDDPERVAAAVAAYRTRYRDPSENPRRVAIEIAVDRILGRG